MNNYKATLIMHIRLALSSPKIRRGEALGQYFHTLSGYRRRVFRL